MRVSLRAEEGEGLGIKALVGPDTHAASQSLEAITRPSPRQMLARLDPADVDLSACVDMGRLTLTSHGAATHALEHEADGGTGISYHIIWPKTGRRHGQATQSTARRPTAVSHSNYVAHAR